MNAVVINQFGGIEELVYTKIPKPQPKPNEVLIAIAAIGINPVDAKARQGKAFAAKLPEVHFPVILGKDVAGTVEAVGEQVTDFAIGDRVFGIANANSFAKTYAEYVATPTNCLTKIPDGISFETAAAAPVAGLTAMQALQHTVYLQPNQRILIHAGAGGVGHLAIQLAKHIGATITATSSAVNTEFILKTLGADNHIDYTQTDFKEYAGAFDVVLDLVGLDNIDTAILTTLPGGDVICIPSNSFATFADKVTDAPVNGHTLLMHADKLWMQKLADYLAKGILQPHISKTYALNQIQEVHRQIESGKTRGKLVVRV